MKNLINAGIILLVILGLQSCNLIASKGVKPKNSADSASYMIGISVGHSLKAQSVPEVNADLIAKGIKEVMESDSALSAQDANMFLNTYFTKLREEKGEKNLEEGLAFLEENKTKEGVIETESGLQYKVIEEGTGRSPKAEDKVRCHYRGTLLNGEEFDRNRLNAPAQGLWRQWAPK